MGVVIRYQHVSADRYRDLVLPDGTPVESLRVGALYNLFVALGIPGIEAGMAKHELIACYETALVARAEAKARAEHQDWKGPSQAILRRAAAELGHGY